MSKRASEIIGKTCDGSWPHDGRLIGADAIMDIRRATCPACGIEYNYLNPEQPCTVDWRGFPPEIDDMLAWLLDNGGIDGIEPWYDADAADGGWEVHFWLTDVDDMHERAPTLSAALEAAVLAVHEAQP
jgi:hypothetical protein